ncbi:hypothetical protein BO70DRAFT_94378 [Aspergillus heteromorphus CBS 117.55]|uniref:Uncharacterized protein n=1 Tax=Aspergillus heteromorphus CBS 117.55 TaxID=1448321 RepID=A0A317VTH2_9EURO|nr:uncharacterized protein BO70DRAFT_94378 [Aspergillus heteromorphus CBS 117.55]PWY76317.1 hypothetical protein BO70DRAFT_94378 [Aspergillus heteromorphus CBS 117.55]
MNRSGLIRRMTATARRAAVAHNPDCRPAGRRASGNGSYLLMETWYLSFSWLSVYSIWPFLPCLLSLSWVHGDIGTNYGEVLRTLEWDVCKVEGFLMKLVMNSTRYYRYLVRLESSNVRPRIAVCCTGKTALLEEHRLPTCITVGGCKHRPVGKVPTALFFPYWGWRN